MDDYLTRTRSPFAGPGAPGGRIPMNAYILIAGFSGIAVFCAMAFKGFGQR